MGTWQPCMLANKHVGTALYVGSPQELRSISCTAKENNIYLVLYLIQTLNWKQMRSGAWCQLVKSQVRCVLSSWNLLLECIITEYSLVYMKTFVHYFHIILNHLQSAHRHLLDCDVFASAIYDTQRFLLGSRNHGLLLMKCALVSYS